MGEIIKTLIGNVKGPQGNIGPRGNRWNQGIAITGTGTEGTIFESSGIEGAMAGDVYLNTNTGNMYGCVLPGNANVAEWVYTGNIKGPEGERGPIGPPGIAATTADHVACTKSDGSESNVQTELTRLNGAILTYTDGAVIEKLTIPSSRGFVSVSVPQTGISYLFATVAGWYNNTGAFSVGGQQGGFYVIGTPGTEITNLVIRFWYLSK